MRNIARDAVVQIAFGGPDSTTAPTWGTDADITGIARQVTIEQSVDTANLAGIGDTYARIRAAGHAQQRITIDGFVSTQSFQFYVGATPESPVGYRVRVKVKPRSSLATAHEFTGIVREWSWQASAGDRQEERIVVEGPIDT